MKYIPAEKLITEIERLGRNWDGVQELQPASLFQADLHELLAIIDSLQRSSLQIPNLDEAAEDSWAVYEYRESPRGLYSTCYVDGFKAGAEWMAGQGWIDDGSMPTETKQESDTLQGHREWTESEPVLAWDSMYGCRVDWTRNGKWMSEQTGGYTGQLCHGIIAWRPIPKYKEKQ